MEYRTAKTYENWEWVGEPYDKKGKPYITVKSKCPRCGGRGIIVARVENNRMIPIPVDQGICYQCGGAKYIRKEVRLYTQSEYESMERSKERQAAKRKEEQEKKMKEDFAKNKAKWLLCNGFNENEETYIVTGDSYSIKDELKAAGFHYNGILQKWMCGNPGNYADRVVKIKAEDIIEFSAWGEGHLYQDAKKFIDNLTKVDEPLPASDWVGEVDDKLTISVILVKKTGFEGMYGWTSVYTFQDNEENLYTWFTAKGIDKEIGSKFSISGTIKKHDEYKGVKTTVLTRCKIK